MLFTSLGLLFVSVCCFGCVFIVFSVDLMFICRVIVGLVAGWHSVGC